MSLAGLICLTSVEKQQSIWGFLYLLLRQNVNPIDLVQAYLQSSNKNVNGQEFMAISMKLKKKKEKTICIMIQSFKTMINKAYYSIKLRASKMYRNSPQIMENVAMVA